MSNPTDAGQRLIYWGIGGFVVMCIVLVAIGPMLAPVVEPEEGYPVNEVAQPAPDGTFWVTLDSSSQIRWVPFDLGLGQVAGSPDKADFAVRRYLLRAAKGAIDLGEVPLAEADVGADPDWQADKTMDGAPQNPALSAWYTYSYWTHQLSPKGHTYAIRRASGDAAYLRFESYYCEPEGTGCLTVQYRID